MGLKQCPDCTNDISELVEQCPNCGKPISMVMNTELYWYGFKQVRPSPVSEVVICGPFNSYEEAKRDRENSKAWDCQLGVPFKASSKEKALKGVQSTMP